MLAYGFFLPANEAVNIRMKKLNLSVEDYVLSKTKLVVEDMELFKKDPIDYFLKNTTGICLEYFGEEIISRFGSTNKNEFLAFIGCLYKLPGYINRIENFHSKINKNRVQTLAENLGFIGYECRDYAILNYMYFNLVEENEIQRLSKEKLL